MPETLSPFVNQTIMADYCQKPGAGGGQVMWPKLVANKLLRWPSGSDTSFTGDFTGNELSVEITKTEQSCTFNRSRNSPTDTHKYKVFVSTWNVGGVLPSDELNLEDWLDVGNESYDIYVLGFQEAVPLSAKNVLGPEQSRVSTAWNTLIRSTLNKSLRNKNLTLKGGGGSHHNHHHHLHNLEKQHQKVHPATDSSEGSSSSSSTASCGHDFRCIISKQMVGILVSVWVRSDLRRYIRHPSVSCVGCGIMGCLGNKGAVSVRLYLQETSFCFVCCHLASGGKEGDEMHRNSDAFEIFSRTSFPQGGPSLDLPQKILDHDRIILLGDLNYRISLPEMRTRSLVDKKEWNILLQNDQLRVEVLDGRAFEGWHEGKIAFSPTYKYYPNSDNYYGSEQGRKSHKRRSPAWCDRILWHGEGLKQLKYDRIESRLSDHRPVRAIFTAEVEVLRHSNSLGSLFMSDWFERIELINGRKYF